VYLKEIYLENFKSFGRKIRIPLLTGFTAITGPNGSGKSNIADAILFVLGPKSSKMIRAGKLTDLIFNGGNKKNPAKYCKVSLIFNNETRVIPIDTDEVRLTRLVKISPSNAENYYSYFYVNGKPSSLNEFENLLAHARISADGYNLVQQGDINRIIQMGKIDRRKIMDDIAGITKFDHDINKAEDKQGAVLENLDRIQILLEEIKNNLSRLKHDRNAAVKFKELKDQMNQAKAQIAHKRKEEVELKIISYTEQIKKFEADRISLNSKLEEYQQKFVEAENTLKELDDKIAEMGGDEAEELKVKIDELRLTQYKATDTIETSRSDIQTAKEEQSVLNRELKVVKKELQNLEKRQTEAANELEEINKVIKDSEAELKKQEEHRSKSSTEILELQREIGKLNQKIDSKHDDIKDRSLELDRAKEKLERMNSVITENQEVVNKTKFEIEELTWRIKDQEKKTKEEDSIINDLTEQYHQCKSKEKKLAKQAQELEEATNRLNREYMKLKAQKDAAESVQKNYSRTVERVLEARDRGLLRGIHGTIAELAEVDKEYERALTVAAGARMQSVVVDNDENASKAIEYLKSEKLGRATFLPLNKMLTGRPRAKALMCERNSKSLGFAIDLIKFDEKYRSAFWYVFGDTVIMEDLYSARKVMGGVRLVTKSGEVIEPSGAMVGGNIGSLNLRFGAPSESDFNNISELLRKSIEESERVSKELQTVRSEMTELEDKIRESNLSTGSTGFQVDDLKAKKKELSDKLKGLEKSFNEQLKDVEVETKNLSEMEGSLADANDEVEKLIQEREDKRELITKSTPKKVREQLNDELNTLLKVKDAMDQKYKDLKDKRDKLFQSRVKLESLIDTTNTKIIASGDLILKAQTNLQTVEDTIADIEAEIQNYENIELVKPIPPMDELNKTIQRLDIAMARLEPINMKAIEDYDIQLERKVNLEEEIKRLLEKQKDLLQIVESLKKKKKEKLLVVFNGVNENFIEIYNELSAGGTAELLLENEDEPFEGGLIIKAKPPNKKLARLEALSGGEKSVVSMALIFAIQQFQPSPFYVLDEVDQNLDAINAEKVANMVRNDASTAQFLMISLRKVSLNRAHHVYGVTIQNNGITDIIGKINLNELGKEGKLLIKSETEIKKPDIDDTDTDSETELERGGMYG
jgi:chromosome segregation protein